MYHTIQKTIAAWAFNHYIAYYYFDNVNVSQLKVAFERGEVELEDLPIKKDALRHFKLPMDVVSGVVGRLSIKVPLMTMLTDPWQIKIKDLMLIVNQRKRSSILDDSDGTSFATDIGDQSCLDILKDAGEINSIEQFDHKNSANDSSSIHVTSEETKLAEFYTSFSSTVSSIVSDIYKNIRLEIEGITILFQESDHGLVKLNVNNLLLHRNESVRNLAIDDISIYLSSAGLIDDMHKIHLDSCNLDIFDESSNDTKTTSETKVEGDLTNCSIDHLTSTSRREGTRNVLKCDTMKIEFKINNNVNEYQSDNQEKNLNIKLDLIGMRYVHSQKIYELTTYRLMNLFEFYINIRSKRHSNQTSSSINVANDREGRGHNKLINVNIEEGLIYVVDDILGPCAIPILEFSLENCRILQFSDRLHQNGFFYGKIGCCYFNREISSWDLLLESWPFNLSWELDRSINHKKISLNSDEVADLFLTNAFLDINDVAFKSIVDNLLQFKLWPLPCNICPDGSRLSHDLNMIFVLNNETGHRLHFAPLEQSNGLYEVNDSNTSPTHSSDSAVNHKLSLNSESSSCRDSPDLSCLAKWTTVDSGEAVSFEFETMPVYKRYISDSAVRNRMLLVRVDGWKTLTPIPIDRTGLFIREACSDRIMNEDTHIVMAIELEEKSARKIISIRSPINLVNLLDATLEVHFAESNQALYIKPGCHLGVPLPYIFNKIHIRPCNVGVTMSERPILWDDIQVIENQQTSIHTCHPITVTDAKHASYCTSESYRICVSICRECPGNSPIFSVKFMRPVTIIDEHLTRSLDNSIRKPTAASPKNYKLASYNHNVNLAERIAGQAVSLFNSYKRKTTTDIDLIMPGFHLTLLDEEREKLLEVSMENIVLDCKTKKREQIIDCSVQDIRVNNLMSDCEKAVMLDRVLNNMDESINIKPAIRLIMDRILSDSFGTTLFKQVQLLMSDFLLNIEEKLILKLVQFFNFKNRRQRTRAKISLNNIEKRLHPEYNRLPTKHYFDLLRIDLSSIKLSVFTSTNLSESLQRLKSRLNLKFFSFEDAQVQLLPYFQMNVSRTVKGVFESVTRFYLRQILEQAPRIVGQQIQNYLRFHLSDLLSTLYDEVYKLYN